ncbi:MAG: heterocyst development glycosyltransferase HepC, partial [Cyanobacteriota bacterium]|nr:heterocyst development glycosyltransferase HepC [Cyanobacteriota bacterium]
PFQPLLDLPEWPAFSLRWRGEKVWIGSARSRARSRLPTREDLQQMLDELVRAQALCLAPELGETGINLWAKLAQNLGKPVFVRLPSTSQLPHRLKPSSWHCKRALDGLVAAGLAIALFPLCLGLAIAIRWTSPGSIFFQQWRVGKRGKLFRIVKFRTMIVNAERSHHQVMGNQNGLHKRDDDPRVTPIGRWMRKYSLDELPQLINVLRGEMSLVGPRPWALYDALRLEGKNRRRLNALPGITGAWQVRGRSHLLALDAATQIDLHYLRCWSIGEDLRILLLTVPKVLSGFGAY